jgi:hypothetical protein|tara:strand:+ start:1761 stop:1934 length:174 start_codon:yes stop_codon:yes gene_type:complete
MNRPLMFINNDKILVDQLKEEVWEQYKKVKGGDFPEWYKSLKPIQKQAFKVKFEDLH